MYTSDNTYIIGGHQIRIRVDRDCPPWQSLSSHYRPFAAETADTPVLDVCIDEGTVDTSALDKVYMQPSVEEGMLLMNVYKTADAEYVFELVQPGATVPNAWVRMDAGLSRSLITIDYRNAAFTPWQNICSLTSSMMLSYVMSVSMLDTILTHSAAVLFDGRAYLFLGKSGTGKSTHARLWLEHIPGAVLMNDDHPIIRVFSDAEPRVVAYGSPWSGKTHCYKNLQARLGAFVRLRQAPENKIRRLSPVEAYAAVLTSFSGMSWERRLADARHKTIETLVATTPVYFLDCLPDGDAAHTCHDAVTR